MVRFFVQTNAFACSGIGFHKRMLPEKSITMKNTYIKQPGSKDCLLPGVLNNVIFRISAYSCSICTSLYPRWP